jgi:hypothetical protein
LTDQNITNYIEYSSANPLGDLGDNGVALDAFPLRQSLAVGLSDFNRISFGFPVSVAPELSRTEIHASNA